MIEALLLAKFRNWEEQLLRFSPTVNIIWGPNAEGKTSLIEALHLLCLGTSFRTDKLSDCVMWGEERFTLQGRLSLGEETKKLTLISDGKERRLEIDGHCSDKLSQLIGLQPVVLIEPHDPLILGTPNDKRRFLDLTLSQIDPSYIKTLSRWKSALLQRNALLKQGRGDLLAPWDEEMATLGSLIFAKRGALLEEINQKLQLLYKELSGEKEAPLLEREEREEKVTRDALLRRFKEKAEEEMRFGFTMTGPHRARYRIEFAGHDAKQAMSEGQMQNGATALRLATWELLFEKRSQKPLLLIDDFGASLDSRRQEFLLGSLKRFGQTFITTVHHLVERGLPTGSQLFSKNSQQCLA